MSDKVVITNDIEKDYFIKYIKESGKFILNYNDNFLKSIIENKVEKRKIIKISESKKHYNFFNNIHLVGSHNVIICNIAIKICNLIGLKKEEIYKNYERIWIQIIRNN